MGCQMSFCNPEQCLTPLTSVFAQMVGAKMECHFNNAIFLIKKI